MCGTGTAATSNSWAAQYKERSHTKDERIGKLYRRLDREASIGYSLQVMKSGIHPNYIPTKVNCNGCNTAFETRSTVPEITVEICSNCHPFYTGKQKLVDTAGRVDKFNARRDAAAKLKDAKPTVDTQTEA